MYDKDTDKFIEEVLKPYFKRQKYNDADELYEAILEREKEFIKLLNTKQRIAFVELRSMFERYADLLQQDSFSNGFFEGIGCG